MRLPCPHSGGHDLGVVGMNKDEIAGLRGLSDDALQKVSNAFDYGETLNVASVSAIKGDKS